MRSRLPMLKERSVFEKVFTCLVVIFALLAMTFIVLESAGVKVNGRLDSLFLSLELLSLGILYYRYNKIISIVLIAIESVSLVLTIIKMFW